MDRPFEGRSAPFGGVTGWVIVILYWKDSAIDDSIARQPALDNLGTVGLRVDRLANLFPESIGP